MLNGFHVATHNPAVSPNHVVPQPTAGTEVYNVLPGGPEKLGGLSGGQQILA